MTDGFNFNFFLNWFMKANMSEAQTKGVEIKSKSVTFQPNELNSGRYLGDTHTAGSLCLLIQSSLPCLLFVDKDSALDLRGGTNAGMILWTTLKLNLFENINVCELI